MHAHLETYCPQRMGGLPSFFPGEGAKISNLAKTNFLEESTPELRGEPPEQGLSSNTREVFFFFLSDFDGQLG